MPGGKIKAICTADAPEALGPYSQAIIAGDYLYVSGQLGLDPLTGMLPDLFEEQAARAFENLCAIVEASELSIDQTVKLAIYLTDLSDFAALNELMAKKFEEPFPARACVEVSALPRGAKIEVEAVVYCGGAV